MARASRTLTKRARFADHSRETFDGVLDLCEQLATRYFAPHNKTSDANEPTFDGTRVTVIPEVKEALDAFAKADLIGMSMDHALGGAQLPACVAQAGFAWMSAANVSTSGYLMLTIANANLLAKFGTDEQIEHYVKPMLAGRFTGTMALSETQAGSSLADITTRAEPRDDGTLPVVRVEDVDLGRGARDVGQHRAPGAGQDPRRARRHQGHLAVHRAEVPGGRRRRGRRAQRRGAGRAESQDGPTRYHQHGAQLRRRHVHARR